MAAKNKGVLLDRPTARLHFKVGCDADCIFCLRNLRNKSEDPGGTPSLAVDFAALGKFLEIGRHLNLRNIVLAGDEPTLIGGPVLCRIASLCRAAGFQEIRLDSNGIALERKELVQGLIEAGVNTFMLPLYGPDAEAHDAITQRPGSFDSLSRAVAFLRGSGTNVKTHLHTVLIRHNEKSLSSMRALSAQWGLELGVVSLGQSNPYIDYRPFEPTRKMARTRDAACEWEKTLVFDVREAQVIWQIRTVLFMAEAFLRLGVPRDLSEAILENYSAKQMLKDPGALLTVLDLFKKKEFFGPEARILACRRSEEALRLGLRLMKEKQKEHAMMAFLAAEAFARHGESDRRAAAYARRLRDGLSRGTGL